MASATSVDPDQPARPHRLIWVYSRRLHAVWILFHNVNTLIWNMTQRAKGNVQCMWLFIKLLNLNRNVRKRTFWFVRPTKTQISLRMCTVWSVSPLPAWRNGVLSYANCAKWRFRSGPEVIFFFSYSTQLSMKISLLINMKMPTIVGIFIFISRNVHAQLCLARKNLQLLVIWDL